VIVDVIAHGDNDRKEPACLPICAFRPRQAVATADVGRDQSTRLAPLRYADCEI